MIRLRAEHLHKHRQTHIWRTLLADRARFQRDLFTKKSRNLRVQPPPVRTGWGEPVNACLMKLGHLHGLNGHELVDQFWDEETCY